MNVETKQCEGKLHRFDPGARVCRCGEKVVETNRFKFGNTYDPCDKRYRKKRK